MFGAMLEAISQRRIEMVWEPFLTEAFGGKDKWRWAGDDDNGGEHVVAAFPENLAFTSLLQIQRSVSDTLVPPPPAEATHVAFQVMGAPAVSRITKVSASPPSLSLSMMSSAPTIKCGHSSHPIAVFQRVDAVHTRLARKTQYWDRKKRARD